jgi:hypothetical protein
LVVVVTSFIAFIVDVEVFTNDSVSTTRRFTRISARIKVGSVAVITGFASIHSAVAAASKTAVGVTSVAIHFVAVIAIFVTFGAEFDILPSNTVATARLLAAVCAGIERVLVAVIASLASIDATVTAGLAQAVCVAAVTVLAITVIAGFVTLVTSRDIVSSNAISTASRLTIVSARIASNPVTIITTLTVVEATVAAGLDIALL